MALWEGPKTECIHGHEYSEANKGFNPNGSYYCRECARIRARKYATQRKARRAEAE
jgi:late competence protein required for DNA uptake (superfamily II DNA/RNA helicase)